MKQSLFFLFLTILSCASASAEVVYLKNGEYVEGTVVKQQADRIRISDTKKKTTAYFFKDISCIVTQPETLSALERKEQLKQGQYADVPKIDGFHKIYYDSGALKHTIYYKNGKMGNEKEYYESGALLSESTATNSEGTLFAYREYYREGILKEEGFYNENDLETGVYKVFSRDGHLREDWTYENGVVNGTHKIYYDNGNIRVTESVVNGKPLGYSSYEENGAVMEESVPYAEDGNSQDTIIFESTCQ